MSDFYDEHDRFTPTNKERNKYRQMLEDLDPREREALERAVKEDKNYYVMSFSNVGGLVMPILLELSYTNGKKEQLVLPAEIWRRTPKMVSKLLITDKNKKLESVVVDANWETADVDVDNNHYPRRFVPSRIEAFKKEKSKRPVSRDIMQDIKTKIKKPKTKQHKK